MKSKKTIVCFTNSYPYGTRETYFETELAYLSSHFDRVIIVPKYNPYRSKVARSLPANVEVWSSLVPRGKLTRIFRGIFNFSPCSFYLKEFFQKRVYRSSKKSFTWLWSIVMFRIFYQQVKPLFKNLNPNVVLYSYWAEAPIFITHLVAKYKKAVRMHRGDFYEDEAGGYLPLRKAIYNSADLLLPISQDIATILKHDYKVPEKKIMVNYLGVPSSQHAIVAGLAQPGKITIVSCSRVDPIKRVDLIAVAVLAITNSEVEWHHFGDGTEFVKVKHIIDNAPGNIHVFLHGWTEQKDIIAFYKQNYVTWFINVSKHEGVPVSIMEAMSFGIPVIATNAGATRELVNVDNGFLLGLNNGATHITDAILSNNDEDYLSKRRQAYATWENRFNAARNFTTLAQRLLEI